MDFRFVEIAEDRWKARLVTKKDNLDRLKRRKHMLWIVRFISKRALTDQRNSDIELNLVSREVTAQFQRWICKIMNTLKVSSREAIVVAKRFSPGKLPVPHTWQGNLSSQR